MFPPNKPFHFYQRDGNMSNNKVIVDYGYTKRTYNEQETIITDYKHLEELKEDYIKSKQLTHSEKLLIEDFYNQLINNHF